MPFDGRNFHNPGASPFDSFVTSHPEQRFDMTATRPTTQNTPLFGLDGAEWRGFFVVLTGALGLGLGLAALLLSILGD
ncbi:hypothetical protein KTR66_00335 [Roseococcus sp. SDR]|uniref:hypothetical protein n=1 Tax=Roseococcus sp. SDR TaxID=2835532 RepID=UPI001BCE11AB|nr:hypothetical protein [Roseococcus sp. SDR]MBS7788416.1 hypothetical protein [Roseococcus sp. SDR]MBV1843730.1 hypothetical protein [Roseococcus sp. SDR]